MSLEELLAELGRAEPLTIEGGGTLTIEGCTFSGDRTPYVARMTGDVTLENCRFFWTGLVEEWE